MKAPLRLLATLSAGALLVGAAALPLDANAQGRHGAQGAHGQRGAGGHWRAGHHGHSHRHGHGHGWGGLALGIGLGALILSQPWQPVIVERPVDPYPDRDQLPAPPQYAELPQQPRPPEPIVYPSQGQSGERLEADRQACNRWATSQPEALADASIFHRATLACLEGRGYTVK